MMMIAAEAGVDGLEIRKVTLKQHVAEAVEEAAHEMMIMTKKTKEAVAAVAAGMVHPEKMMRMMVVAEVGLDGLEILKVILKQHVVEAVEEAGLRETTIMMKRTEEAVAVVEEAVVHQEKMMKVRAAEEDGLVIHKVIPKQQKKAGKAEAVEEDGLQEMMMKMMEGAVGVAEEGVHQEMMMKMMDAAEDGLGILKVIPKQRKKVGNIEVVEEDRGHPQMVHGE